MYPMKIYITLGSYAGHGVVQNSSIKSCCTRQFWQMQGLALHAGESICVKEEKSGSCDCRMQLPQVCRHVC